MTEPEIKDSRVTALLTAFVAALDQAYPGRVRAIYLSGSSATGDSIRASDVDGLVIFRGSLGDDERDAYFALARNLSRSFGIQLDLGPRGEDEWIATGEHPAKTASRIVVYGEDIRDRVRPTPIWRHVADCMRGSWFYLAHVRGGAYPIRFPLSYPDPNGEFFGYERNGLKSLGGWTLPGTKALIGGATLAASTLVGIRTGEAIVRSGDSITAYKKGIGDEWTTWLVDLYREARARWGYDIPVDPADRRTLRGLCAAALEFENHFLSICRVYLEWELGAGCRGDERAAQAGLQQPDPERRRIAAASLSQLNFTSG